MRPLWFGVLLAWVAALASCQSTDAGTVQILTGGESDTFGRPPAPTSLSIDAIDPSGHVSHLATASLPIAGAIDLGGQDESTVATLEVTGTAAGARRLVFGASLPVNYGALAGVTLPIFVQRTGELARLPHPLPDAREAPVLSQVQGQYVFIGGGSTASLARTTQLYDFAQLRPLPAPPSLPRAPETVAFVGTVAMLIDAAGASYFDFASSASQEVPAPQGGAFADVAGGRTIPTGDGTTYVVGATRTSGAPTAAVLVISPKNASGGDGPMGPLAWATLSAPRLGAAATWVTGRGLVVAGGSATASGVEILAPSASMGSGLAYAPDPSTGAGATPLDGQHVLLAGGLTKSGTDAGNRAVDLGCSSGCRPTVWEGLPVPLTDAQAWTVDASDAFLIGSEAAGPTHAFRLTPTAAVEIPFKVPRKNARAIVSPVGSVVIVGGAREMESFIP